MKRARAVLRGQDSANDTRSDAPVAAGADSVYTCAHGATAGDRRNASDGAHHSLHSVRAAAVAAGGASLGADRLGSGAPPARRGDLTRIAVAIERLAGAHERVAGALERATEAGRRDAANQAKGPSAMSEVDASPTRSQSEYVTQKNCVDVLGLTPRRFLELLRREDAPPVLPMGKLRLVPRDAMLAYVARLGTKVRADTPEQNSDGADAVLREIGCAPVRR